MVLPLFVFGRCYCQVAVVVATTVYSSCWQMLLLRWLMECLPWVWMADVIAKVADGIATGPMSDINVIKMGVRKSTLENLQEPCREVQRTPEVLLPNL